MYRICVNESFSSAHRVDKYPGKCKNLHGHNWKLEASIDFEELDDIGISIDFKIAKKITKAIADEYDHKMLNDLDEFIGINPTAENISRIIFRKLQKEFKKYKGKLYKVAIWETENNKMEYFENE